MQCRLRLVKYVKLRVASNRQDNYKALPILVLSALQTIQLHIENICMQIGIFIPSVLDFGEISRLLQLINRGVCYIKLTERGNT